MEDFGPIIWTLVLVGFGVYSIAAQARKKNTEAQKKHEHSEAWPSWDSGAEESVQEEVPEAPVQKDYIPMKPAFEEGTDAEPAFADEQMYTKPDTDKAFIAEPTNEHQNGVKTAYKGLSAHNTPTPATKITTSHGMTEDNAPEEQEFDLRKAVIYSEILKPKFDE